MNDRKQYVNKQYILYSTHSFQHANIRVNIPDITTVQHYMPLSLKVCLFCYFCSDFSSCFLFIIPIYIHIVSGEYIRKNIHISSFMDKKRELKQRCGGGNKKGQWISNNWKCTTNSARHYFLYSYSHYEFHHKTTF